MISESPAEHARNVARHRDVEAMLAAGRFVEFDALLVAVDVDAETASGLLGLLTFAWHAREHLQGREVFAARVRAAFLADMPRERARSLLINRGGWAE